MSGIKLRPGVVTGDEYLQLLEACKEGGYALPAVNVTGTNSLNAVLEAAAKAKSDIIVQMSNGGAQFYAGQGAPDAMRARVLGSVSIAQHVHLLAEEYGICVVLHTDHCNRKLLPWVDGLLDHGEKHFAATGRPLYTSHMIDLSEESLEDNVGTCADYLKRMAPMGMSLEIELGVTGGEEDGIGKELEEGDAENPNLYTQPEDVLYAYDELSKIGHFTVAASFGNVHGVYAPGNVKLRPEILKHSQALVSKERGGGEKPLSLVFHGGSGSSKEQIAEAVSYGVFKMNLDTDIQFAYAEAVAAKVDEKPIAFKHQVDPEDATPYKKYYDPRKWLRAGELGMVARVEEAMQDLGSAGRSVASLDA
ncbi:MULTISPECIES: class II fructose-bisphosphate aldolase [Cohaesibacter]|uniref:class II fructose-bisphosphate aldolase n=1 Tax=Cohaesibacter TaxID=655352 RepID=UPI000DE8D6B3|nr:MULTISPECIES: class II fructose-bisphosphate aldolase [Cohaesibacter]TLP46933.1 class II fructose-bisphosphate aldolase [Cohaesibacter sp. CAU 1516]